MLRKKGFILSAAGILVFLVVFIYLTPFAGRLVANTRLEGNAKSIGIRITQESPPLPLVTSGKTQIPVTQGSYCWGKLGCADYVGGQSMVQGVTPTVIAPEGGINVAFTYKPAPGGLTVQQFVDDKEVQIPLKNGSFNAPKEQGVYYYGISAFWTSEDGKFSEGSSSVAFVIEVKSTKE
ncbi:hypothetical protein [Paenibacillus sp. FSL R7-277]|uniref:hypothetical protein n=1 Tax=Paenibacillus sp. FSL R7-277 TaxID=1227352 RepID=UPI0012DD319C|nr:hypothetical protein [Paenibacillus sp. FSL R7-277]